MRTRNAVAASAAVIALVALGLFGTASAGPGSSNTFTVEKVVVGPVPEGAVFEVEVTCEGAVNGTGNAAPQGAEGPVTMMFDDTGAPIGSNTVPAGAVYDCTAVETVTNGATVTYACDTATVDVAAPAEFVPVECLDDQTVHFDDVTGAEGTVTVTNTFEEEPEPEADTAPDSAARQPSVVAARPAFTG